MGLYIHSTGGGHAQRLLKKLYGDEGARDPYLPWEECLQRIRRVEKILIGLPCDTGAGILRGANLGPIGVREAYLKQFGAFPRDLIDVGDVLCIPQLLHDEMVSDAQKAHSRAALYPGVKEELPVSPLSMLEQALYTIQELNPNAKVFLIGGDHSSSWPAILAQHKRFKSEFGLLHFDAHDDLTDRRLGVKYCFSTWAFHALKLLKPQALVQVGIRNSPLTKEQWTQTLPITQFWANEVKGNEAECIGAIIDHFKQLEITRLYITNDVDATDSLEAPSTGTPEPEGLSSKFVLALLRAARSEFELVGGDVVEVAPALSAMSEFHSEPTSLLGARYLHALLS